MKRETKRKLKEELKELKEKYYSLTNEVIGSINFDIEKTDDLKESVPALKNDFLKGKITIDTFIKHLGEIYATAGYEIGVTESQKIHDLELEIEKLEDYLGYLED